MVLLSAFALPKTWRFDPTVSPYLSRCGRRLWSSSLRHRLWSITARQNASAIAQHDQPARILGNAAAIDRPGNRQVVMPINDLLLAGAFAALFEQFDGILAFGF
jgi:hypothetical protein